MMRLIQTPLCRLALVVSALSLWSCASTPELDIVLGESPRGAVYLERIPDRSFQAAHPLKIDQEILGRVLQGISVKEDQGLLHNLIAGKPAAAPAFTEDEIRFLVPLLAEGLTRAASDQQVGFRLIQTGSPGLAQSVGAGVGSSEPPQKLSLTETSRGSLYAYGRSLYITLLEYHVRPERADTINMANRRLPDSTGLVNRTVLFLPESAKRPDSYRGKNSTDTTLVIDYEFLATLPASAGPLPATATHPEAAQSPAVPAAAAPETDQRIRSLQEDMRKKNVELEELRKELQDIRRQMSEPSTSPPKRKPGAPSDTR